MSSRCHGCAGILTSRGFRDNPGLPKRTARKYTGVSVRFIIGGSRSGCGLPDAACQGHAAGASVGRQICLATRAHTRVRSHRPGQRLVNRTNDLHKRTDIQGGAANEQAVDVGLVDQFGGVLKIDTPPI